MYADILLLSDDPLKKAESIQLFLQGLVLYEEYVCRILLIKESFKKSEWIPAKQGIVLRGHVCIILLI